MSHDLLRDCQLKLSLVLAADDPLLERIEVALNTDATGHMTTVPLLSDFGPAGKMVGSVAVQSEALPGSPGWHIALAYVAVHPWEPGGDYQLHSMAITPDEKFKALESTYSARVERARAAIADLGGQLVEKEGVLVVELSP